MTRNSNGDRTGERPASDSERARHRRDIEAEVDRRATLESRGAKEILKYGVSGGPISALGTSYRATRQVNDLVRIAARMGETGIQYGSEIIDRAATRRGILDLERDAVTRYFEENGERPIHNLRPNVW